MDRQDQLEAAMRAQKEAEDRARQEAVQREKQQTERSMKRRLRTNSFFGFVAGVAVMSLVVFAVDVPMLVRQSNSIVSLSIANVLATPTALATPTPWPTLAPRLMPTPRSTEEPVQIVQMQVGNLSICIVTEEGGVKCKPTTSRSGWQSIKGLERDVSSIVLKGLTYSSRYYGTEPEKACALLVSGSVQCWSWSNSSSENYELREVVGSEVGASAIVLGNSNTCVLTNAGGVKCLYENRDEIFDAASLADVAGVRSGVRMIAAGNEHVCALLNSGGVKCWGQNDKGQLGDGWTASTRVELPRDVVGLDSGVKMIAAGGDHTCAVMNNGTVKCWGAGAVGQLGNGGTSDASVPQEVIELVGKVASITLGSSHTCALMEDGSVKCWGSNSERQLGEMPPDALEIIRTPQEMPAFDGGVIAVVASDGYTCSLLMRGGVSCLGGYVQPPAG